MRNMTVTGKTMARFVALAQARPTRLGETCRSRPGWHTRTLAQAECSCFEQGTVSLRRETLT